MTDDAVLLRRYLTDRSQSAFAEIVERYVHLVYGAALRQVNGDVHRAEDVTQTVFVLLARKARSLADRPVLAGWLHTAARFVARDNVRRERRLRRREQEAQIMHQTLASTPPEAAWDQLHPIIDDALAELDERDREAVLLRFFGGHRFSDIGAALRLTDDAARRRVDRAVERLRLVLARRGITSTSAALAGVLTYRAIAAPASLATKAAGVALAGGSAGFGFWTIISTSKGISGVSAVVALFAVGFGVLQVADVSRLDAALARERGELKAQLQQAGRRVAELEARTQNAAAESAAFSSAIPPTRTDSPGRPVPSSEAVARAATMLQLGTATHVAYVIDTSGSMRDPTTTSLRTSVVEQLWAILAAHPQVLYVQVLDSDGRFILSHRGGWIANEGTTRDAVQSALLKYPISSNSNPVPGITRAIRTLPDPENPAHAMSVVVLGDEITADEGAAIAQLDQINPADTAGRRRFAIYAVGFANQLPESERTAAAKFADAMRRITTEHGGAFVESP